MDRCMDGWTNEREAVALWKSYIFISIIFVYEHTKNCCKPSDMTLHSFLIAVELRYDLSMTNTVALVFAKILFDFSHFPIVVVACKYLQFSCFCGKRNQKRLKLQMSKWFCIFKRISISASKKRSWPFAWICLNFESYAIHAHGWQIKLSEINTVTLICLNDISPCETLANVDVCVWMSERASENKFLTAKQNGTCAY